MGLTLCNSYTSRIYTTIMFYNPEACGGDGQDFETRGWWPLDPGSCALVYGHDLDDVNRFWYYFAMADDGAVWAGPFGTSVPRAAFRSCYGTATGGASSDFIAVGYRE